MKKRWALAAVVAGVLLVGATAQAHEFGAIASFDLRYIAGTVHVDPVLNEAVGTVDCQGTLTSITSQVGGVLGGGCVNLAAFAGKQWFLRVSDGITQHVSVFAGFDTDGDGCVGCVPGADNAFEGIDTLGSAIPTTGASKNLAVFVRAVSSDGTQGEHLGTTGVIHVDVFDPAFFPSPCERGGPPQGKGADCGERFDSNLPYPYPCLGTC